MPEHDRRDTPSLPPGPTAPPPGYVWAYPPPPPPTRKAWRPPRWLKITTVAWAVLLVAGGTWYALHGQPSVREQTTVGQARPVVDRAIVDVVDAAGGGPVVAVSGFDRVGACTITVVRSGASYHRVADFYTSPGTESAVLHAIASRLPARYHADTTPGAKPTLYVDAGHYVAVRGSVPGPGIVEVSADTGCRKPSGTPDAPPTAAPGSTEASAITQVVGMLGRPASPGAAVPIATVASLACPSSGTLRAAETTLPPGSAPASLVTALAGLSPTPAANTPTTYAFRSGPLDIVAKADPHHAITITATRRCPTP